MCEYCTVIAFYWDQVGLGEKLNSWLREIGTCACWLAVAQSGSHWHETNSGIWVQAMAGISSYIIILYIIHVCDPV